MRPHGQMDVIRVEETRKECSGITSILFQPTDGVRWKKLVPGQFVMVWIPGVDEVPMSLSYHYGDPVTLGITVQNIGEATNALCSLKEGDHIGIRGPYGNGFSLPSKEDFDTIIGVSGGVGTASTILPMEWAHHSGFNTINLIGARTEGNMLFRQRMERSSDECKVATDDGSAGHHGFVTDVLAELLDSMEPNQRKRTMIFTCGPEMMMVNLRRVADDFGIRGQYSLERFMKCGIGLCDSCSVSGRRVCMDGPIFTSDQLHDLKEFGRSHRDRSGRSVPLKECVR